MNSKIVIILIISFTGLIFSQTTGDINELLDLYEKYKDTDAANFSTGSNNLSSPKSEVILEPNYIYSESQPAENGYWRSKQDYKAWLDETARDESVKHLYGFVINEQKHFGYDIFNQRDSIAIWPNVAIPDYYILGPGDKIEIALWGRAQILSILRIDRDGNLYDPNIGKVSLAGKSLKEARAILKNKFGEKFSSLKGENPATSISITISDLKSINVHFTGYVKLPGLHIINPLSTVITGLYQAGGVDTLGTLRNIQIIRDGTVFKEIDLYDYLLKGDVGFGNLLRNNDVINVPPRGITVKVTGEVLNEGIFEARGEETLHDVVEFAGGFKINASEQLLLARFIPIEKRRFDSVPLKQISVNINELADINCLDGDILTIQPTPQVSNYVTVSGKVKNPGQYVLTEDLTIKKLLMISGGIEDPDFLKAAYLEELEILRVDDKKDEDIVIKLSFNDIINTAKYDDFKLMKDDHIIVRENIFYRTDNLVEVTGEVMVPGVYPIIKDNQTLDKIIQKAGGFTDLAFVDGIKINRNEKRLVWHSFDVPLISGDKIIVPQKPGVVEVRGEVNNPGLIYFSKGRSLLSYVRSAGGFTNEGKRNNVSIIYPNGNVKKRGILPKTIEEGCIIEVYRKPDRNAVNLLAVLEQSVSIISSLALTYIAIQAAQ